MIPAWVLALDDDALRDRAGTPAVTRGTMLALSGKVSGLQVRPDGALQADVEGSAVYRVVVRASRRSWTGDCTCPVGFDCKHAVAVLVAARPARPARQGWQEALEPLLQPEPAEQAPALALVVDGRVRLRPARDKGGNWVHVGASWQELTGLYGHTRVRQAHRDALLRLHRAWTAVHPTWYAGGRDAWLPLADVGPEGFGLLAEAVRAGVVLLDVQLQPTVTLDPDPVELEVDLRDDDGGVRLEASVPGAVLVGPAGVVRRGEQGMLLSPLRRPLGRAEQALVAASPVRVPAGELSAFRTRYYPRLRSRLRVVSSDGSVALPDVGPPRLGVHVKVEPGHRADVVWSFRYPVGDDAVVVPLEGPADLDRDEAAERALLAALPVAPASGRLTGADTARFVGEVLPALAGLVEVELEGDPAPYAHTDDAPVVSVSAVDRAGERDWFDLGVAVSVAGQAVPLGPLLAALTTGEAHLVLDSGTWFDLDRPELEALRALLEESRALVDPETGTLRVSAYQAGLWDELVALGVVAEQSARWRETVGRLLEPPAPPDPPAGLQGQLRPYQLQGYGWLSTLWDLGLGGVLADDMGLGKTITVLAAALRLHERGDLADPLLVVAPSSVVGAWQEQAARFCPGLPLDVVARTRQPPVEGAAVVVTSYAVLRLDADAFLGRRWAGVVLDEAQQVKNPRSKAYAVVRQLDARVKTAVTGTPMENSLMDLWALLSVVAPGLFPDPKAFGEAWRAPIESGQDPARLPALRRRIAPLLLRRTKEQVAAELPPKVEQVLEVQLAPAHRRLYDQHLHRERQRVLGLLDDLPRNRFAVLRSLTLLRQLALDPALVDAAHDAVGSAKVDELVGRLQQVAAEGHRALVFSSFTGFLARVRARLDAEGIAHAYLDGRTRDRARRIEEFRRGDMPAFLISLKAGGTGLTLTEADYVFVLDPWWNPAAEAQAVDRAHRIGQDRTVMVYRLVSVDTVEQKVVALQQRKRALFDAVVEGDGAGGVLTAEDLRELLGEV